MAAQLLARPGMTAVRLPFKPVLVFVPSKSAGGGGIHELGPCKSTVRDGAEVVFNGLPGVYSGGYRGCCRPDRTTALLVSGALQG